MLMNPEARNQVQIQVPAHLSSILARTPVIYIQVHIQGLALLLEFLLEPQALGSHSHIS